MKDSTHTTVMAALLHYGLSCYDHRHCIDALYDMGMPAAALTLDSALRHRVYKDVGVRDWDAEEVAAQRER